MKKDTVKKTNRAIKDRIKKLTCTYTFELARIAAQKDGWTMKIFGIAISPEKISSLIQAKMIVIISYVGYELFKYLSK